MESRALGPRSVGLLHRIRVTGTDLLFLSVDAAPTKDVREGLLTESRRQAELAAQWCSSCDAAQLRWRPKNDKWSVAEHLSHLSITTERYTRALRVALHRARKEGLTGQGPFKGSLSGRLFLKSMEPPVRLKVRTFRQLEPPEDLATEGVLTAFREAQKRFDDVVHESEGIDLGRATMRSPFVRILRLTLAEALEVVLAHNRRHFWHIERILRHPGFPRPG